MPELSPALQSSLPLQMHRKISQDPGRFAELATYLSIAPAAAVSDRLTLTQAGFAKMPRHLQLVLGSDFMLFEKGPYHNRPLNLAYIYRVLRVPCSEYLQLQEEAKLELLKACYQIGRADPDNYRKFRGGIVSLSSLGLRPLLRLNVAHLLESYGLTTLEDLVARRPTTAELRSIPGLGPKGFEEICRTLAYFGEEQPTD